jgi:putative aldouronate transport system substrate-binding protein
MKNIPEAIEANNIWFYPNEELATINKLPVGMTLTAEESIRLRELGALETYVNESAIQFITGQMSFAQWETYVARVNALGAPEVLTIHQAAYDRWRAR